MSDFRDYLNVYSFTCELPGTGETVEFKPVTTGQLKRLLTYENETNPITQENALDDLLRTSITTEGFNVDDLYLEDRFFLLVELRKKTKGEVLEFTNNCKKCESQSLIRINLDDLPVTKRREVDDKTVQLTEDVSVTLKHITRRDQRENLSDVSFGGLSEIQLMAELQLYYQALAIESVITPAGQEDDLTVHDKKYIIESVPTTVFEKMRNAYEKFSFGVDMSYEIKCINCGETDKISVPIESNFFF